MKNLENTKTNFQDLDLEVGERATCSAGYPKKSRVTVECIKDFFEAKNSDEIINNALTYVKIIDYGLIGIGTSHLISSNWEKL